MTLPMQGFPPNGWQAEGALGGFYGGAQGEYQSRAIEDAQRQSDLENAIKQHELQQSMLNDPVAAAQRNLNLTNIQNQQTLAPDTLAAQQTQAQDVVYSSQRKKMLDDLADKANFYEGAGQSFIDMQKASGGLSTTTTWNTLKDEGKKVGVDIGDAPTPENIYKLQTNYQKATASKDAINQARLIMEKAQTPDVNHQETNAMHMATNAATNASNEKIHSQNNETTLAVAKLNAESRNMIHPRTVDEMIRYKMAEAPETVTPAEIQQYVQKRKEEAAKIAAANPAAQLAAIAQTGDMSRYADIVKQIRDAYAQGVPGSDTAPSNPGLPANAPVLPNATPTKPITQQGVPLPNPNGGYSRMTADGIPIDTDKNGIPLAAGSTAANTGPIAKSRSEAKVGERYDDGKGNIRIRTQ